MAMADLYDTSAGTMAYFAGARGMTRLGARLINRRPVTQPDERPAMATAKEMQCVVCHGPGIYTSPNRVETDKIVGDRSTCLLQGITVPSRGQCLR